MGSKSFRINTDDLKRVGRGALMAGAGAAALYVAQNLHTIDVGSAIVLFVPVIASGLEFLVTWIKDNSK